MSGTTAGSTLLLDLGNWDLMVDVNGNIALAAPPYALAQDAVTAIKTFLGECWYNTTLGIDWYDDFLGAPVNLSLLKSNLVAAAETVPGVVTAKAFITGISERAVTGQVQVTDASGVLTAAAF